MARAKCSINLLFIRKIHDWFKRWWAIASNCQIVGIWLGCSVKWTKPNHIWLDGVWNLCLIYKLLTTYVSNLNSIPGGRNNSKTPHKPCVRSEAKKKTIKKDRERSINEENRDKDILENEKDVLIATLLSILCLSIINFPLLSQVSCASSTYFKQVSKLDFQKSMIISFSSSNWRLKSISKEKAHPLKCWDRMGCCDGRWQRLQEIRGTNLTSNY